MLELTRVYALAMLIRYAADAAAPRAMLMLR